MEAAFGDDVETLKCIAISMVRCSTDNLRGACACVWLEPLLNVLVENLSSPFPAAKHAPLGQKPGEWSVGRGGLTVFNPQRYFVQP